MQWLCTGAAIYTNSSTDDGPYARLKEICSGTEESLDQCKIEEQVPPCTSVVGIVCQQGETVIIPV